MNRRACVVVVFMLARCGGDEGGGSGTEPGKDTVAPGEDTAAQADTEPGQDSAEPAGYKALVINEFMASNQSAAQDEAGDFDDWVEIANPTDKEVSLGSLYLSDDETQPAMWKFPQTASIKAGDYVVVWTDKDPEQGPLHADFKLKATGEAILLVGPDGKTVVDSYDFGEQQGDVSMARVPDMEGKFKSCATPTAGKKNKCD